ncbi:hypothetical protein, partial [Thiolapillus sp.]|uniref:hypothetical protein n=1 Tax=Thiolapillus sp. TaxID=2017437 RepID=UPI003AF66C6F
MFSLWRKARRENSAASRLLGSTSLRFALHGWQRRIWGFCQFHSGRLILVGIIRFIHVEASMILKNGLGTLFARMSVIAS